jgi:hypothetical protein
MSFDLFYKQQAMERTNRTEFSDLDTLKRKPAHMAVFLNFVLEVPAYSSPLVGVIVAIIVAVIVAIMPIWNCVY